MATGGGTLYPKAYDPNESEWPYGYELATLNKICKQLEGGTPTNIDAAGTTVVTSGPGQLVALVINTAVASGVITLYDNTVASGTKLATVTLPAVLLETQKQLVYRANFLNGLTVVTVGSVDITVVTL